MKILITEAARKVKSILSKTTNQVSCITDCLCRHLHHRSSAQNDNIWTYQTFLYMLHYDRITEHSLILNSKKEKPKTHKEPYPEF